MIPIPFLCRRFAAIFLFTAMTTAPTLCASWGAAQVWDDFAATPHTHPNIPNNAFAGYRGGAVPIPDVPVVLNLLDFGGSGDGVTDNTAAFQRAIETAWVAGGGAVYIPPGIYVVDKMIHLNQSGVVLRGAGPEATTIRFPNDMDHAAGAFPTGSGGTHWFWQGGLLWMGPAAQLRRDFTRVNSHEGLSMGNDTGTWWPEEPANSGFVGRRVANVTGDHAEGSSTVEVDDVSELREGMYFRLVYKNNAAIGDYDLYKEMAGHPLMHSFDWAGAGALNGRQQWVWPVRIARIEGNTVILDQPLRVRTRPQFETGFEAIGVIITESGVEDLTVELTSAPNLPDAHSHNVRHNAIYMTKTVNCWVRNVDIVNAQNGLMTRATKHVELRDIRILGEVRLHHAFSIVRGHDNLITDFVIEPRVSHGISVEDLASGNVFRRGQMGFGTDSGGGSFDSHRYMSFDLLRTDIYVLNTIGRPGGNNNTGPLVGRRVVHWNIQGNTGDNNGEWVNHPDAHSLGALVGVQGPRFDGPAWAMVPGDKGNIIADEGVVPVYPDLYDKQMQWRQATEAWAELTHPHLDLIPPGLITLAAEINPGQADLQSVTFLVNDQPLHTVTEAPFTAPWETSGGVYDVRVIAQTSAGVVTSPRRQIIVGQREIVEDTDSRLVYTGPKTVSDDGNSSGGTHTDFRAQNNAYVTFDFRGTRFMIYIRSVQRDQQRMEIFINDLENPVALISPPRLTEYRMLAFDSGPLPDGDHTVRIRPPDNRVTLDYILIDNTGEHGGGGGSPDPIPVTGVDLHPESLSLYAGATEALTAAIAPANASNPNVNWSSSNPSVATVNSSGLVAGVGQGSTTITVTTVDGGFTASTSVTVIDLAIGAGIIMDSEDSSGILITGSWNTSTAVTGFLGSNYLHDSNNGKGSKSVQFTPVIGQAGIYEVAVLYTSDSNRANNVPVEIMHDGEISQVIVNQRTGGGHWYVLGNYSFTAGTGNSVTISNASTNGFVIVDAVRFVLFEPDVTEPPVLFADWIAQFDDVTPSDRGKLATPARDGIANLLKYAFGAGPLDDAVARLPVYWTESGENGHHVYMRYNRLVGGTETGNHRYAVNDLVYRVGVSHDLVNWTFPDAGEPSLIEPVGLPVADPDDPRLEQVVFRLHTPLHPAAQPRAFLRLLVDTSSE